MSEEKSEESIEFDLDEILEEDISDENLPQIEVEEIEELVVVETEDETDDDGATFQDQVRDYMGELEDEETDHETNFEAKDEVNEDNSEIIDSDEPELATVSQDTLGEVESRIMSASRDLDSMVQNVV